MVRSVALWLFAAFVISATAHAADPQVERGKYLVAIGGCTDCHTPGHFFGHPDMARFLGGSDVGFGIPGHGVFVGPNLTPDKETGLGNWTAQQIVTAITTGERPDGRMLAGCSLSIFQCTCHNLWWGCEIVSAGASGCGC